MEHAVRRELPASLVGVLRRALELEVAARGTHRERVTVAAFGMLLLAANEAGWYQYELGALIGRNHQTVQKRILSARARLDGSPPGLEIEPPPAKRQPISPHARKRQPVEERQWLSTAEAARHAGCSIGTIRNWQVRGLLPNTDRRSPAVFYYLRADLDRVRHGPRRGPYTNYREMSAQIAAATV